MTKIAIVYFSGHGHTAKQAEAVKDGAASIAGSEVVTIRIAEDGIVSDDEFQQLAQANAIIFGSPTYMGGPAWQFKRFADASAKVWFAQGWKGKLAAGFTNSGSLNGDKSSTINYLFTLSQQHGQIWVGTGLLPANKMESGPSDVNWPGSFAGAMAISPSGSTAEQAPRSGDLETARLLGARVAELSKRF